MRTKSVYCLRYCASAWTHPERHWSNFKPPLLLRSPYFQTVSHLLSHIYYCPRSFVSLATPFEKTPPQLSTRFFVFIHHFIHLTLYSSYSLTLPVDLLDSLRPSFLSSLSVLASLVSSSTHPHLSLDIIRAFPPALFVDLGSHFSLSLSLIIIIISCLALVTLQSPPAGLWLWAMSLNKGQVGFL